MSSINQIITHSGTKCTSPKRIIDNLFSTNEASNVRFASTFKQSRKLIRLAPKEDRAALAEYFKKARKDGLKVVFRIYELTTKNDWPAIFHPYDKVILAARRPMPKTLNPKKFLEALWGSPTMMVEGSRIKDGSAVKLFKNLTTLGEKSLEIAEKEIANPTGQREFKIDL